MIRVAIVEDEAAVRDQLMGYVQRQYTGANVIVAVCGPVDPQAMAAQAEAVFGAMPAGAPNLIAAPVYLGGVRTKRMSGSSQTHVVLGFPVPTQCDPDMPAAVMAATVFGEGMSSPLLDRVRERLGLVYYAGCSADVSDLAGQFVIEASTTPEHLDALFTEVTTLLQAQAASIDPVHLERARNQLAVRSVRARERSQRRLEGAAQDLFVFGRVRPSGEWMERIASIDADEVRLQFERMLAAPVSAAITGKVPAGTKERCQHRLASLQSPSA